jgi:tetratricopeptide (TPR) repeat protein
MIEAPVLLALLILTYNRSKVWSDPVELWSDTAKESPHKVRPNFQLAFAYYERQDYSKAVEYFEIASHLAPPDYLLLVDWGFALDRAGLPQQAIEKLREATAKEVDPHAWALLGMVYGEQHQVVEALNSLQQAQTLNPNYSMTYGIRGGIYEQIGDFPRAREQYQRAVDLDPNNEPAREGLGRVLNR